MYISNKAKSIPPANIKAEKERAPIMPEAEPENERAPIIPAAEGEKENENSPPPLKVKDIPESSQNEEAAAPETEDPLLLFPSPAAPQPFAGESPCLPFEKPSLEPRSEINEAAEKKNDNIKPIKSTSTEKGKTSLPKNSVKLPGGKTQSPGITAVAGRSKRQKAASKLDSINVMADMNRPAEAPPQRPENSSIQPGINDNQANMPQNRNLSQPTPESRTEAVENQDPLQGYGFEPEEEPENSIFPSPGFFPPPANSIPAKERSRGRYSPINNNGYLWNGFQWSDVKYNGTSLRNSLNQPKPEEEQEKTRDKSPGGDESPGGNEPPGGNDSFGGDDSFGEAAPPGEDVSFGEAEPPAANRRGENNGIKSRSGNDIPAAKALLTQNTNITRERNAEEEPPEPKRSAKDNLTVLDEALSYEEFILRNPGSGALRIQAFGPMQSYPIQGVNATVSKSFTDGEHVFYRGVSNCGGIIGDIVLPTEITTEPQTPENPHPY